MGIPATGKRFDIAVIDIIEFRDGKGVAQWGVMDMAGMMEQLGVGGPTAEILSRASTRPCVRGLP